MPLVMVLLTKPPDLQREIIVVVVGLNAVAAISEPLYFAAYFTRLALHLTPSNRTGDQLTGLILVTSLGSAAP